MKLLELNIIATCLVSHCIWCLSLTANDSYFILVVVASLTKSTHIFLASRIKKEVTTESRIQVNFDRLQVFVVNQAQILDVKLELSLKQAKFMCVCDIVFECNYRYIQHRTQALFIHKACIYLDQAPS